MKLEFTKNCNCNMIKVCKFIMLTYGCLMKVDGKTLILSKNKVNKYKKLYAKLGYKIEEV